MAELQTIEEIEAEYTTGWVLIGDPEVDESTRLRRGRVLFHSPDRETAYARLIELPPGPIAVRCFSPLPDGMELML